MSILKLDTETRSPVPIKDGTWAYAAQSEILIVSFQIDDGPVDVWGRAERTPMPSKLEAALNDPGVEIWAHNAAFDRCVMLHSEDPRLRCAARNLNRWHCSMALAYAHSLPGSLEKLGETLNIAQDARKSKRGKELMRLFCIPPAKSAKRDWATPLTHPAEWAEFKGYARQDVVAMDAIMRKVPRWNYKGAELALWRLDQKINARGVAVDMPLVHAAIRASDTAQAALAAQTTAITEGEVSSANQRDALLAHILSTHGVKLPDMRADTLERRLNDPELPQAVRDLIAIRLQASMNSVAKYKVFLRGACADGRMRGTKQFCGAGRTGRWAGRLVQLDNMPRPTLPQDEIDMGIGAMKAGAEGLIFDNVMTLCSSAIRGCLIAPPGRKLVVADLANIEGRVAAWLAGEDWKLQAFRDYDAGTGPDLYVLAYARAFNTSAEGVSKTNRQIGKVMELMLSYGGGVGAFLTGAATYGIDLDAMTEAVYPTLPVDVVDEAQSFLAWMYEKAADTPAAKLGARHGLSEKAFIACDSLKRLWRRAHPAISSFWKELEGAFRQAVYSPGVTIQCRRLKFRRDGNWLRIGLPSGRAMCFLDPQVADDGSLSYAGVSPYTRQWGRVHTYGGKLLEGPTQAAARDQLAYPMPLIEDEGYEIVAHVHDEVNCEVPDTDAFTHERLTELMCSRFPWNEGLPLAAAGFSAYRYRKD